MNAQKSSTTKKNDDGTSTTEIIKIKSNYTVVSSMDQVESKDHLLVMVDGVLGKADKKLGGGEAVGIASTPGQIAYTERGSHAVETAFHEVGHNLGLRHPNSNNASDPMSYTGRGANFSSSKMGTILDNAVTGAPNRGENSGVMRTYFPEVSQGTFFGTANNDRPFVRAPSPNSRIPRPLNND